MEAPTSEEVYLEFQEYGLIYIPIGVFWYENMNCQNWSDLGIPDFPMILDDSEDWIFPGWFGAPFPVNIILNQDMEIIHRSIGHYYSYIRADIFSALSELPGNENLVPDFEFGVDTEVAPTPDDLINQLYPDIAIDENNRLHIVWLNSHSDQSDIFYNFSDNGGMSFSPPVQINSVSGSALNMENGSPKIRTSGDNIYIAWSDIRAGENQAQIYLASSQNNGQDWSELGSVDQTDTHQIFPDLEIGQAGSLHLIYTSLFESGEIEGIRYTFADPGEMIFSASTLPDLTSGFGMPATCSPADLEVSEQNDLFIAFRNNVNGIYDHFIAPKPHDQNDFNVGVPVSYSWWSSDICPTSGPSIDATFFNIAAAYQVQDPANTYLRFGSPESMVFQDAYQANEPAAAFSQDYPSIQIEREFMHAVWVDDSQGDADIYYGMSKTFDAGVFNVHRINDVTTAVSEEGFPKLLHHDGELYCVWISDLPNGQYRIFFDSTLDSGILPGDVNQDNILNVLDIILIVNFIIGNSFPDDIQFQAADLNADGILNILDIVLLLNQILEN